MANPKFLSVEKKVPYNIRLPQRLIDKYNAYAELTGNTTTNIINTVLDDFISDKIVLNDYLENIGGITVKIPYSLSQKAFLIQKGYYLEQFRGSLNDGNFIADTFEIKRIPNNLDVYIDDSYKTINKTNVIHSGIDFFIYDISESILDEPDKVSLVDALYCLYFEVKENNIVRTYLCDYLSAINLLSASGNESDKDLIIGAVAELKKGNEIIEKYDAEMLSLEAEINEKYSDDNEKYFKSINKALDDSKSKYKPLIKDELSKVANKYNSGNIILFGSDIFSRIAVAERNINPDYFDEIISEKADHIISEKLDEIIGNEIRTNKWWK